MPVLQQVMAFAQARQKVLADNVSNFDTVGYKMKDLPSEEFFAALSQAVENRDRGGAGAPLAPAATGNLRWDRNGNLHAKPVEIENSNILFHDQNNRSVEAQMSKMAQNGMLHNIIAEMLRGQYAQLQTAIRGNL